ncbi:hypothetical protein LAZ29_03325 [Cereibacter sphaeroides]|uniref:DnaA N-terminal domain-containing protein n=1 Tax=Cereibacter sphaeroides TaxID=1063 RepID=UPI001F34341E|nr:DnaA N-terminal domain-containing protein [Cereibacter sphaeroides]MCE6949954.1 hypothetical protein [Cereibacter sphaeroides]
MLAASPVGREASTKKYDILTALGAYACQSEPGLQRLTLRLITLITARYNWRTNELTVGRREISRLWGVDERTVKRETGKLKAMGWLVIKRAGVRGRVTAYGLDLASVLMATRDVWPAVGPDFVARLEELTGQGGKTIDAEPAADRKQCAATNVVPFRARSAEHEDHEWGRACHLLEIEEPGLFAVWIAPLARIGLVEDTLELAAPSRFHASYVQTHLINRLHAALGRVTGQVRSVRVIG